MGLLERAARWRPSLPSVCVSVLMLAGCSPAVTPAAFEEDDPRAARAAAAQEQRRGGEAAEASESGDASQPAPTGAASAKPPASASPSTAAPSATSAPVVVAVPPRPLAPPGTGVRSGSIDRLALLRVLDAGPGGLLRTVEVSPFFEGSRFRGWRLDQIVDATSPLAGLDLASGDIILAVNRRPVARPEHVMAIWQELRGADELVCQVWRGARAFELRFAITPRATSAQAAAPAQTPTPGAARSPVK